MSIPIFAAHALLPDGWHDGVRLSLDGTQIARVEAGVAPQPNDERCDVLLPGVANLHSHAFQRGMAGLAERRGGGADTFWTWRETMYAVALALTPREVEAIAAQLFVEMLEAGFVAVGEFHYLHHGPDGTPYDDLAAMAAALAGAAEAAGISLTLLPTFYAHSGFGGAPPGAGQRRFVNDLDRFERLVAATQSVVAATAGARLGLAVHSLRAATPEQIAAVAAMRPQDPLHVHVAEQAREVEDCLAWWGRRPVELLLDAGVDARWCLVHATHTSAQESIALAASGAVAGLCPVTEANLGDGTFAAAAHLRCGGRWGIGSDSNVLVGVADELRQLEYAQRLDRRERNVLAAPGRSTGRTLLDGALVGGAQALGRERAALAPGASADLVALDAAHPALLARRDDALLDAWIFASSRPAVAHVWCRGRKRVSHGRHVAREAIGARFAAAMSALAQRL